MSAHFSHISISEKQKRKFAITLLRNELGSLYGGDWCFVSRKWNKASVKQHKHKRGSWAYLPGCTARTQAYTGAKGGEGDPLSPGARTRGHQYLQGLRPLPAAGQTERWCLSPHQLCPPGPADGPGISTKDLSFIILWPHNFMINLKEAEKSLPQL